MRDYGKQFASNKRDYGKQIQILNLVSSSHSTRIAISVFILVLSNKLNRRKQ
jgi:hypothetical protein